MVNVGIDVDDVMADFVATHRRLCRTLFGRPTADVEPVDWQFSNYGLTEAEHEEVWRHIQASPDFWLSLDPLSHTSDLRYVEFDPVFVTARVDTAGLPTHVQTSQWIEEHYGIVRPAVIVTNRKGLIAAALDLDYFVDDRLKNCRKVRESQPQCVTFLHNRSHNVGEADGFPRVESLNHFLQLVQVAEALV